MESITEPHTNRFHKQQSVNHHPKSVTERTRYIHPAEARAVASTTLMALALEHASHDLEKSANQAVGFEEIDDDQFLLFVQREGYSEKLSEVRQLIRSGPLHQLLYRLEEWYFNNKPFEEIQPRR